MPAIGIDRREVLAYAMATTLVTHLAQSVGSPAQRVVA